MPDGKLVNLHDRVGILHTHTHNSVSKAVGSLLWCEVLRAQPRHLETRRLSVTKETNA